MYEVVWARMMTHVFGTTATAVGTIIAAFMSGLAVGSWLLGKTADRSPNPLRLYAYLEIGVGLAALGAHLILDRLTPVYLAVYEMFGRSDLALGLARFILVFCVVMVPTMLMGATLPVLSRFVLTHLSAVGADLSALYAINTVGAVAGTTVTGFYLVGVYGIHLTVYSAVLGNIGIGVVAWIASARAAAGPAARAPKINALSATDSPIGEAPRTGIYRLLLLGFAISGFTSFAYEIYWTRSLVFLLGNSTYAVTTMLTAFLTGIALGGYLVRFIADRVADRIALFGWIQIFVGVSSSAALPLLFFFAEPQAIREFLIEASDQVNQLVALRFGVAFLVMLIPATLIGTTFPLVGRIGVQDLRQTGSAVGQIYAVNTLGNVVGALLPGVVLLHWFGIQPGILAMAVLNVCVGVAMLLSPPVRFMSLCWAVPAVCVSAALVFSRAPLEFQFPARNQTSSDRVLFYREGPSATTKVFLNPDTREKSMSVDGITIGGTGFTDYKQQLLAHLPKLLVEEVSAELSVGLGSGILVGESARHDRIREITCVEIEPSVVAGAAFFSEESHNVLRDPRLRVVVDDVLNHLRITADKYHIISADEKTLMDYASNGLSYSREYYDLLRSRLAPGGLLIQWVPTGLPPRLYRMVLKTFTSSFPHALLWYSPPAIQYGPTNTILLGSTEEIEISTSRVRRSLNSSPTAFAGIAQYGLTSAEAVLAHFMADETALREAVRDSPENTLDHPRYEFFSFEDYAVPLYQRLLLNHDFLMSLRRSAAPALLSKMAASTEEGARLREAFAAEEEILSGYRQGLAGAPRAEVTRRFESALALAPWNDSIRSRVFLHYRMTASEFFSRGLYRAAASFMQRAVRVYGKSAHARTEYAIVLLRLGARERAMNEAQVAVDLDPKLVLSRRVLADILLHSGRRQEAKEQLQALLEIEPEDAAALEKLSRL